MAKKVKRQVRKETPLTSTSLAQSTPVVNRPSDFNPDYSYVIKDLKRIGTLAGIFFVILIGLSFFI